MKNWLNIRNGLFVIILLMLLIPAIQHKFRFIDEPPLKGDIQLAKKEKFSAEKWFSGKFQEQNEKHLTDFFGFRNYAVRLNNQLAFNLFKIAKANGVVIGKENYLYEYTYIDAYYGTDYLGEDSIKKQVNKLKRLQDTLSKLDKTFVLAFASGKGSFYPEYFPESYNRKKSITNNETYIKYAQQAHLNYIDFNSYFFGQKNKSPYPLYPKYGIHWSQYAMCVAADSLIGFIEQKRHIDMCRLYWDKVNMDYPREADYDIADGMNLLCKLKTEKMAYPEVKIEAAEGKTKPSILVIADSFYWGIYGLGFTDAFSSHHFWYYNKQVYPESITAPLNVSEQNLQEQINNHDIILIMATEAKLPNLGWGFIESADSLYSKVK